METARYYTPREVSEILKVSPAHVLKLIHEKRLYAVRLSERVYRVPVGALERLELEPSFQVLAEDVQSLPALGEGAPSRSLATAR
jgi:excisionase family DNA binding protein